MTPEQDKAKELVESFKVIEVSPKDDICITFKTQHPEVAKECALICVDESIKNLTIIRDSLKRGSLFHSAGRVSSEIKSLKKVKKEIEAI